MTMPVGGRLSIPDTYTLTFHSECEAIICDEMRESLQHPCCVLYVKIFNALSLKVIGFICSILREGET